MKMILSVVAMLMLVGSSYAGGLEDLLAKSYASLGGVEKVKAIQSMKSTGKMVVQGGALELAVELLASRNQNRFHMAMDMQGQKMIMASDGKDFWTINPMMGSMDPQDLTEQQRTAMQSLGDIDGDLIGYEEKGYTLEHVGSAEVEGTPCEKVKVTKKNGEVRTYFLDSEMGVPIKMVMTRADMMGGQFEAHSFLSEYQEVAGWMVPHSTVVKRADGTTVFELQYAKIEANLKFDDTVFTRPAPAPAPTKPAK